MGADSFYARHGSAGVLRQRHHQGRLVGGLLIRHFYCCRFDTGNAANDCNNLSCERCCFHEQKQTIVKNLNSIQNFGAIDILCTDKTGTLTQDKVVLEYHLNVNGEDDTRVLRHAYLNSYFQTGYKNLMDLAIIHKTEEEEAADSRLIDLSENYVKVDEIPFDFTRRRLTTVVQDKKGKTQW